MSADFGSNSSVKVLQWLTQYKKLNAKDPGMLSSSEQKILADLTLKLGALMKPSHSTNSQSKSENLAQRRSLRIDTHYKVSYSSPGDFQQAYIRNLSGGGVFIETDRILEMGTQVELEVLFPDEPQAFKLKAEVAWTNPRKLSSTPQGMGLKFVELSDRVRNKINQIIEFHITQSLNPPKSRPPRS